MQDRQSEMQNAMIEGDRHRVLEITSKTAEGAEHVFRMTGSAVVS